jgi:hypothetical protein
LKYTGPLKRDSIPIIYKNVVRTSHETCYVYTTEPNQFMPLVETVAVYCENRTEHTDTHCGQDAVLTAQ